MLLYSDFWLTTKSTFIITHSLLSMDDEIYLRGIGRQYWNRKVVLSTSRPLKNWNLISRSRKGCVSGYLMQWGRRPRWHSMMTRPYSGRPDHHPGRPKPIHDRWPEISGRPTWLLAISAVRTGNDCLAVLFLCARALCWIPRAFSFSICGG